MAEKNTSVALAPASISAAAYHSGSTTNGKTQLRDYWEVIQKHLGLIIGLSLLVTMVVAIYLARKPDVFVAQALVQIDLEDLSPVRGSSKNNSVIVSNSLNDPAYFNTQLRILTSYGLLSRVAATLDLQDNPTFLRPQTTHTNSTWQNLLRTVGLGNKPDNKKTDKAKTAAKEKGSLAKELAPPTAQTDPTEAERYAPLVKELLENLQVEPVVEKRMGYGRDTTRLIEIKYKHPDPLLAAQIVNTMADVLARFNLERKAEKSVSTGDFLQKRIAELQGQIRNSEERLLSYAKSKEILSLDGNQNTVVDRLTGLNKQLLEAENERKLAESAYNAALAPGAASALAEDIVIRQMSEMRTKLADLRQKRAQLLVDNTEQWPEVTEVNQQINVLEKEMQQVMGRASTVVLTNLETRYRQAEEREQAIRKAFKEQRGDTLTQNEAAVNYRIIQQEIETNKGLLNDLLQSYKENDVVLAGLHNNVGVIDYAITPDKPVGPNRLRGILLALLFSLPCGIGLALALEYFNNTVRSLEEVERMLHLPALAAIPTAKTGRERTAYPALLFNAPQRSPVTEAYRQLRTAVLLSTPGRAPKTLLVTSAMPSEGKTTSSVNLAISLAQTKAKILIIDADLRRPRLHTIFGLNNRRGLSTYLSSEMSDDELLGMIQQHELSGLSVLTSGPVPPNPAELLGSEPMRQLLDRLQSVYTHIIVDSAPAASFTDAVLLSAMVDGLLLVVRSGSTPTAVVRRVRQLLLGANANIIGAVLTQVNGHQFDYYYQNSYYYLDRQPDAAESDEADAAEASAPIIDAEVITEEEAEPARNGSKVWRPGRATIVSTATAPTEPAIAAAAVGGEHRAHTASHAQTNGTAGKKRRTKGARRVTPT